MITLKNIEIFNNELNRSHQFFDDNVINYVSQIDSIIKSVIDRLHEKNRAIIIGTGKMGDFSIEHFVRHFQEIVLTDVDVSTMRTQLDKMTLNENERLKLKTLHVEYTGFEAHQFFTDFKERIINCHNYEKLEQVLRNKMDLVKDYTFLKEYQDQTDLMFVSPIYTQLVYQQVLRECSILRETGYPEHLLKYIEEYMLDAMVPLIDRFNDNLIRAVKHNGEMIVLSDILQLDNNSPFYRRVKNSIRNFDVMEEIYQGYQKKYGLGLGDYGLFNLDEKVASYLSRWLIWPFDRKSSFVVKLKIYRVEKT